LTEPTPTIRRGVRGGKARENAKWANEEDESDNTEWVDEKENVSTFYLWLCSCVPVSPMINSFIRSFVRSFVRSFFRSFIHSFLRLI